MNGKEIGSNKIVVEEIKELDEYYHRICFIDNINGNTTKE
jgi:hypothetical protein